MSVLEIFQILFESDSAEVDEGAKKAKKSTDDLEDQIKTTNISAKQLGDQFLQTMKNAVAAYAAIASVGALMNGFNAAVTYADQLDETSEALGIAVEDLDVWGRATKMAGGTTEGFIGSIKSLSTQMTQLDTVGKSKILPFLKDLGISILDAHGKSRPALELFPELADAFSRMSKQEAIGYGRKLGLDDGVIMLLQKGRREVDALIERQKQLGVLTEEEAATAAAYKDSIDELSFAWRNFAVDLSSDVLPVFTWIIQKFTQFGQWAQEHEGFLYGFFGALAAIMGVFAVKAAIAAAAVTVLGFPFYLVAAAVAAVSIAIGLLWDDFQKFREGAAHLIPYQEIIDGFTALVEGVKNIWGGLVDYLDESIQGISRALSSIGEFFSFGDRAYAAANARRSLAMAGNSRIGSQTSASLAATNNRSSTVTIGKVDVNTQATDADGIAGAIGSGLQREMQQVTNNSDDGIRG